MDKKMSNLRNILSEPIRTCEITEGLCEFAGTGGYCLKSEYCSEALKEIRKIGSSDENE